MFGWLFGRKKQGERPALTRPDDLQKGDMVEFDFSDMSDISGKSFLVESVNQCNYGGGNEPSLVIFHQRTYLGLSVIRDGDVPMLCLSKRIQRSDVEKCFDMTAFGQIFDEGYTKDINIRDNGNFIGWIKDGYYHENTDCIAAKFIDERGRTEPFDFYELRSVNDSLYSVEIEVYDGETEIYLCRLLPMHVIRGLWPKDTH